MKPCPSCKASIHDQAVECKHCRHQFRDIPVQTYKPDRVGTIFLIALALLFGFGGLLFASEATGGVAAIALGCLLAILARIEQAGRHHRETMDARRELSPFERQQQ